MLPPIKKLKTVDPKAAYTRMRLPSYGGQVGPWNPKLVDAPTSGARLPVVNGVSGPWSPALADEAEAARATPQSIYAELVKSLPKLDPTSYTKPYDDATTSANAAYGAAVPTIKDQYAALRGQLEAGKNDVGTQYMGLAQGAQTRLTDALASLQGRQQQTAAALQANGVDSSLLGRNDVSARDQVANLKQSGTDEQGYLQRMAQVAAQGSQDRIADSGLAQTDALANASTNLQSILGQIGLGRASASQQAQKDSFGQQTDLATLKSKMANDRIAAEAKAATERAKQVKELSTTPHDDFVSSFGAIRQQYPQGAKVFQDLVKHAGSGPLAKERALQALEAAGPALSQGGALLDSKDPNSRIDARINPQLIASWVEAYYDKNTKRLNGDAMAQLGL